MPPLAPARRRRSVPSPPPARPGGVLRLTGEEYLARERDPARAQARKSELFAGGEVREMPGVSFRHSRVVNGLSDEIAGFLDKDRFEKHVADVKFRPPRCRFFYPDLMVAPNPPLALDEHADVLLNPVFVAEVLSPSTEATDRGEKQVCYLNTPSVLEYWLLSQSAVRVERHHRTEADGDWDLDVYEDRGGEVPLPALGGAVSLAAVYRQALPPQITAAEV